MKDYSNNAIFAILWTYILMIIKEIQISGINMGT